jgi:hypothetical protein
MQLIKRPYITRGGSVSYRRWQLRHRGAEYVLGEADRSLSSAEVGNAWSVLSPPPIHLQGVINDATGRVADGRQLVVLQLGG